MVKIVENSPETKANTKNSCLHIFIYNQMNVEMKIESRQITYRPRHPTNSIIFHRAVQAPNAGLILLELCSLVLFYRRS
jgi:hypothetical protein